MFGFLFAIANVGDDWSTSNIQTNRWFIIASAHLCIPRNGSEVISQWPYITACVS